MAKHINSSQKRTKEKVKKEGLFSRTKKKFLASSEKAKKATVILFIMILLSVISGIFTFYLAEPAKELYVAENAFIKETRSVYDYAVDSEERTMQQEKADEAIATYGKIVDEYKSSENAVISGYASIHSNFIKILIALAIVLPFIAIVLMFIGSPVNFLFAVINMVIVMPITAIVFLFNSFRGEKEDKKSTEKNKRTQKSSKSSKHLKPVEAA